MDDMAIHSYLLLVAILRWQDVNEYRLGLEKLHVMVASHCDGRLSDVSSREDTGAKGVL
jgi:hypothetical protein